MKVRSGFVSNSSSSSFILGYTDAFDVFNIGKKEIVEAISTLSSMKEGEGFQVFDLSCEKSKAAKAIGGILDNFNQTFLDVGLWNPEKDNADAFRQLLSSLNKISSCYFITGNDDEFEHMKDLPAFIKDTIRMAREKLKIKTAYEVMLDHENAAFAIHFDDNTIYNIDGMNFENDSKDLKDRYESEACSGNRFIEVLFKWLVSYGYIDPKKKELLERYPLDESCKKKNSEKISWLHDDTYTWKDFVDEGVLHAVLHEG